MALIASSLNSTADVCASCNRALARSSAAIARFRASSAFSPVAVSPDELGDAWKDGKLHLPLLVSLNGKAFGKANAGIDMTFDFGQLVAHAAKTRPLVAGTIIGSGTVSNKLDGGPGGKGMWVAYGLGNFISNQDASTVGVAESVSGVLLRATFTVSPDDDVSVDAGWTAVTVDRLHGHVVYPISKNSGAVGKLTAAQVKSRWNLVHDAVGDAAPEVPDAGEPHADGCGTMQACRAAR